MQTLTVLINFSNLAPPPALLQSLNPQTSIFSGKSFKEKVVITFLLLMGFTIRKDVTPAISMETINCWRHCFMFVLKCVCLLLSDLGILLSTHIIIILFVQ